MIATAKLHWLHLWNQLAEHKTGLDLTSIGLLLVTLMGALPHITAVVTLIWSCVRLYETKTVQGWLSRRRARKGLKP
jgi:hypothetical protein